MLVESTRFSCKMYDTAFYRGECHHAHRLHPDRSLLVLLLAWFIIALIWGKPWSIKLLYSRTFLKFALKGPGTVDHARHPGEVRPARSQCQALRCLGSISRTRCSPSISRDLGILRSYPRKTQAQGTLLSTDIMDWFLDDVVRSEKFRHHDYPLNQMFGIQSELPNFMMTMHPVVSKLEGRNYVKRLKPLRSQVRPGVGGAQDPGRKRRPAAQVRHPPRAGRDDRLRQPTGQREPALHCFQRQTDQTGKGQRARTGKACSPRPRPRSPGRSIPPIKSSLPISPRWSRKPRLTTASGNFPSGSEYYAHCLRSNTTTEYTPEQVHEIGLKEVTRIEGRNE